MPRYNSEVLLRVYRKGKGNQWLFVADCKLLRAIRILGRPKAEIEGQLLWRNYYEDYDWKIRVALSHMKPQ